MHIQFTSCVQGDATFKLLFNIFHGTFKSKSSGREITLNGTGAWNLDKSTRKSVMIFSVDSSGSSHTETRCRS